MRTRTAWAVLGVAAAGMVLAACAGRESVETIVPPSTSSTIAAATTSAAPTTKIPTTSTTLVATTVTSTPGSPASSPAGLTGAYLGQRPPGSSPEIFAPGIVQGDLHTSPVFTPDGREVYWSLQDATIVASRLENGVWTQPKNVAFSVSITDYRDPFVSPSGDKLFFLSKGKLPGSQLPEKENIWFVERSGKGWGEPRPVNEDVNALDLHWQISVAADGDLYFSSGTDGIGDIYVSKYQNGDYVKPAVLDAPVNTSGLELTPYIAPDESYLIFARLEDPNSSPRLFISYAGSNGDWGEPVLLDTISYGLCPAVSPDGDYLFYLSRPDSVSWMNTGFIRELRPDGG